MLCIHVMTVSPFEQNSRLIWEKGSKDLTIIDPGDDSDGMLNYITEQGFHLKQIFLTHSHVDHIMGFSKLVSGLPEAQKQGIRVYGHANEKLFRQELPRITMMYGLPGITEPVPEPDQYLSGGESFSIGSEMAKVLFVPGHSPGHLALFFDNIDCELSGDLYTETVTRKGPLFIAGDTLFRGSIGRTDLPGSVPEQLMNSLKTEVMTLDDDSIVLSGHGPDTEIGIEKLTNPFLKSL